MESEGIVHSDIVEAYQNPDIAFKYEVTGVPATIINGKKSFVGVPNLNKFVKKLFKEGKE
ncbi:MAG: thioredoxin family protein [Promethearchaeota archaeon]